MGLIGVRVTLIQNEPFNQDPMRVALPLGHTELQQPQFKQLQNLDKHRPWNTFSAPPSHLVCL